jgi:SAM-dependent methyltransferase
MRMMRELRACIPAGASVLDVGGANVNGSYRTLFDDCRYTSLDLENADIIVKGYDWPIEDESFDAVISGQTLEHDPQFWRTVQNMARVVRRGGHIILIVPSTGPVHRHPVDCWRFLPDSMAGLAKWAALQLVKVEWSSEGQWRDLAAVMRRAPPKK